MGWWNDRLAYIKGNGNLTLGADTDDAAFHATYTWAKNDVTLLVSPADMVSTTLPAITRTSAGIYHRTLAASVTHNVLIPLSGAMFRTYLGDVNIASQHGVLVKSLAVFYRVNVATLTSFDLTVQRVPHAAGAAIYTATNLAGTVAGNTLTFAANVYAAVITLTTAFWNNTADQDVNGEAVIVTPATSTCDLLGAAWRVAVALY